MAPETSSPEPLPLLHRAVLVTVLYGDLFDHPLTVGELHRFLTAPCPDREALERAYQSFVDANRWVDDVLPQREAGDSRRFLEPAPRHRLTSMLEAILGGRLGDAADRAIHRALLLYYRLRLRRHGWRRRQIEHAYTRDRQVVVTGGYASAVARRFVERGAAVFDGVLSTDELTAAISGATSGLDDEPGAEPDAPDPLYAGLLATRYGGGS